MPGQTSQKKKQQTQTAAVADKTEPEKPSRQQMSKTVGINLSVSRVRKHVDKFNVNKDVEKVVDELKTLQSQDLKDGFDDKLSAETKSMIERAYVEVYEKAKEKHEATMKRLSESKLAADKKKLKEMTEYPARSNSLDEYVRLVSKLRYRFSNDASIVLSSALDYIVQDLVRLAMVNARRDNKAIIQVSHITQDGFKSSCSYPFVNNLKVVEDALASTVASEEQKEPEKVESDDKQQSDDTSSATFKFYVGLICKEVKAELVKQDEQYSPIRISDHIRVFCSDVVVQFIERVTPLIKLYTGATNVRTVNDGAIKFILDFLSADSKNDTSGLLAFVKDRLDRSKL